MSEWIPVLIAVVGAIPGGLAIWKQYNNDKRNAEEQRKSIIINGAEKVTGTAMELIDRLNDELIEMRKEQVKQAEQLAEQEIRIKHLTEGVIILSNQILDLGHTPAWKPE